MTVGTKNIYDLISRTPKKPIKSRRLIFFPTTIVSVKITQRIDTKINFVPATLHDIIYNEQNIIKYLL